MSWLLFVQLFASSAYIIVCAECASVVRNSITSTDANKLKSIQHRFQAFCFNRVFPKVHLRLFSCIGPVKTEQLTCNEAPRRFALCIQVYLDFKFGLSVFEIVGFRISLLYFRDCSDNFCSSSKNCYSAANAYREVTYLEPELLFLVTFLNGTHIILIHNFNLTCMFMCMCEIFSRPTFS
jgi:hypothetical protein